MGSALPFRISFTQTCFLIWSRRSNGACCKIKFRKIRPKKKLERTTNLTIPSIFFNAQIFHSGLKTAFCNRPFFWIKYKQKQSGCLPKFITIYRKQDRADNKKNRNNNVRKIRCKRFHNSQWQITTVKV